MRRLPPTISLVFALAIPVLPLVGVTVAGSGAHASPEVDIPRAVPAAKIVQQVGLTEVSVEYDCPAVKGRKIWGDLVPFGQVWTIGVDPAAKLKLNRDATVGGQAIPAGTYWLLAIPTSARWTFVLNKSPSPIDSARDYKPELDVARFTVSPAKTARRERLMFSFSDVTDDHASLDLEWDTLRASIPIQVNTTQEVLSSISTLDDTWRSFANAARYMLESKHDFDAGLKYIDEALALREDWYCLWVKGALYAAKGDFASAHDWASKALDLEGRVGNGGALEPELRRNVSDWGGKGQRSEAQAHALKKVGDDAGVAPKTAATVGAPEGRSPEPPPFNGGPKVPRDDPPPLHRARLRRR